MSVVEVLRTLRSMCQCTSRHFFFGGFLCLYNLITTRGFYHAIPVCLVTKRTDENSEGVHTWIWRQYLSKSLSGYAIALEICIAEHNNKIIIGLLRCYPRRIAKSVPSKVWSPLQQYCACACICFMTSRRSLLFFGGASWETKGISGELPEWPTISCWKRTKKTKHSIVRKEWERSMKNDYDQNRKKRPGWHWLI